MNKNLIICISILLLTSCGKDVVIIEDPTPSGEDDVTFETNLVGFTTDESRIYLSESRIEVDGDVKDSDENGLFYFDKILVGKKGKVFKVDQEGFLPTYYRVNHHNRIEEVVLNLSLTPAPNSIEIGVSGGEVPGPGATLILESNDLSSTADMTFHTSFGEDVNQGNQDALYKGEQTQFLLKAASFYIHGSASLTSTAEMEIRIEKTSIDVEDFSKLGVFYYDETELTWKQKDVLLSEAATTLSFEADAYGWWTIAENRPAQYSTIALTQEGGIPIVRAEVDLSFEDGRYGKSVFYSSAAGTISSYFPIDLAMEASLNNHTIVSRLESGVSAGVQSTEITFSQTVQQSIEGEVYACDFTKSEGLAAILFEGGHKIVGIDDGKFVSESPMSDEEVKFHFYSDEYAFSSSRTVELQTLTDGSVAFFACSDLDDNLTVTEGSDLLQDFENCRIKIRPKETVVIGEGDDGDVFLVSFEGTEVGVFDGLFYNEKILDDVKSEVVVNIILYDEEENKVGGFINTEYISTGDALTISFIGNIE